MSNLIASLIDKFTDMANRGTFLMKGSATQDDLLNQLIGTIVKVSIENDEIISSETFRIGQEVVFRDKNGKVTNLIIACKSTEKLSNCWICINPDKHKNLGQYITVKCFEEDLEPVQVEDSNEEDLEPVQVEDSNEEDLESILR